MQPESVVLAQVQSKFERGNKTVAVHLDTKPEVRRKIIRELRSKSVEFVERSDWRALPERSTGLVEDWRYSMVAIHHAGRSFGCGPGALQLQEIQKSHMNHSIAPKHDVAYHYAIDCLGTVYEGRDIRFKGEHLSQFNTGAIGIVLLENLAAPGEGTGFAAYLGKLLLSQPHVPTEQSETAKSLIDVLKKHFPIKMLGGHREFPHQQNADKICPGNIGMSLVRRLRAEIGMEAP